MSPNHKKGKNVTLASHVPISLCYIMMQKLHFSDISIFEIVKQEI